MVKPRSREDKNTATDPELEKKIEAFAAGADLNPGDKPAPAELNKDASRDFKSIRVPFNEYEYNVLDELCKA
ncbi:hypothetical protein O3W44_21715 [Pantoea sp. LMR881]|uniref:hypothetical protein n=1 Tax=Pantoea sp. LMR881 TaxID=3014336 RepID=UPI0022AECE12|nr:hypothetical protein [Pantoea sp. LMR881]MCZ4061153.1 hypothetical protein [Pantoea sp. LMR881]